MINKYQAVALRLNAIQALMVSLQGHSEKNLTTYKPGTKG